MTAAWQDAGVEPDLDEILGDPLVGAVMKRDGIGRAEVEAAIIRAKRGLARRQARGALVPSVFALPHAEAGACKVAACCP